MTTKQSSEHKFTPGPWHIGDSGSAWNYYVYGPNARLISTIEIHLDMPSLANARLIAAAPELLKKLKAAEQALRSYQYGNSSTDLAESVADAVGQAIQAATGEEAQSDD